MQATIKKVMEARKTLLEQEITQLQTTRFQGTSSIARIESSTQPLTGNLTVKLKDKYPDIPDAKLSQIFTENAQDGVVEVKARYHTNLDNLSKAEQYDPRVLTSIVHKEEKEAPSKSIQSGPIKKPQPRAHQDQVQRYSSINQEKLPPSIKLPKYNTTTGHILPEEVFEQDLLDKCNEIRELTEQDQELQRYSRAEKNLRKLIQVPKANQEELLANAHIRWTRHQDVVLESTTRRFYVAKVADKTKWIKMQLRKQTRVVIDIDGDEESKEEQNEQTQKQELQRETYQNLTRISNTSNDIDTRRQTLAIAKMIQPRLPQPESVQSPKRQIKKVSTVKPLSIIEKTINNLFEGGVTQHLNLEQTQELHKKVKELMLSKDEHLRQNLPKVPGKEDSKPLAERVREILQTSGDVDQHDLTMDLAIEASKRERQKLKEVSSQILGFIDGLQTKEGLRYMTHHVEVARIFSEKRIDPKEITKALTEDNEVIICSRQHLEEHEKSLSHMKVKVVNQQLQELKQAKYQAILEDRLRKELRRQMSVVEAKLQKAEDLDEDRKHKAITASLVISRSLKQSYQILQSRRAARFAQQIPDLNQKQKVEEICRLAMKRLRLEIEAQPALVEGTQEIRNCLQIQEAITDGSNENPVVVDGSSTEERSEAEVLVTSVTKEMAKELVKDEERGQPESQSEIDAHLEDIEMQDEEQKMPPSASNAIVGNTTIATETKATVEKESEIQSKRNQDFENESSNLLNSSHDAPFGQLQKESQRNSEDESVNTPSIASKKSKLNNTQMKRVNKRKRRVIMKGHDKSYKPSGGAKGIPKVKNTRSLQEKENAIQQIEDQFQSFNIEPKVYENLTQQLEKISTDNSPANDFHSKIQVCYKKLQQTVKQLSRCVSQQHHYESQKELLSKMEQDQININSRMENLGLFQQRIFLQDLQTTRYSQQMYSTGQVEQTNQDRPEGQDAQHGRHTEVPQRLRDQLMELADEGNQSDTEPWLNTSKLLDKQIKTCQKKTAQLVRESQEQEADELVEEMTFMNNDYQARITQAEQEESKAEQPSMPTEEINAALQRLDANWKKNIVDLNTFVMNLQVEEQDRLIEAYEKDLKSWFNCLRKVRNQYDKESAKSVQIVTLFESMHSQAMPNEQVDNMLNDVMDFIPANEKELEIQEQRRDEVIELYLKQHPKTKSLKVQDIPVLLRTDLTKMISKQFITGDTFQPITKWNLKEVDSTKNKKRRRTPLAKAVPNLTMEPEILLMEDKNRPRKERKWQRIEFENHMLRGFQGNQDDSDVSEIEPNQMKIIEGVEKDAMVQEGRVQLKRNWNILHATLQNKFNRLQSSTTRNEWSRIYKKGLQILQSGHKLETTEALINLDYAPKTDYRAEIFNGKLPDDSQFKRVSDYEMQQELNNINTAELSVNQDQNIKPKMSSQHPVVKAMEMLFWRANDKYLDTFVNTVMVNELFSIYSKEEFAESPAYQIWLEFVEIASQATKVLRDQAEKLGKQKVEKDLSETEWEELLEATRIVAVMSPQFSQAALHGMSALERPTRKAFQLSRLLANVYPKQIFGVIQRETKLRADVHRILNNMETYSIHPEFLIEENTKYASLTGMEAVKRTMQSQIRGFEGLGLGFDSSHAYPELMIICRLFRDHSLKNKEESLKRWVNDLVCRKELHFLAQDQEMAGQIRKLEMEYRDKVLNKLRDMDERDQIHTLKQAKTDILLENQSVQLEEAEYEEIRQAMPEEATRLLDIRVKGLIAEKLNNQHFTPTSESKKATKSLKLLPAIEISSRIKSRIQQAITRQQTNVQKAKEMTSVLGLFKNEQGYSSIMDILDTACPAMLIPTVSRLVEATLKKATTDQTKYTQEMQARLYFLDLLCQKNARDELQKSDREEVMARCRAACDIMNNVNSLDPQENQHYELLDALDWYLRVYARAYRAASTTVKMEAMMHYLTLPLDLNGPYHQSIYGNPDVAQPLLDSIDTVPLPQVQTMLPGAQLIDALNALAGRVCFTTIDSYLRAVHGEKKFSAEDEYMEIKNNRGPSLTAQNVIFVKQGSEIGRIGLKREMRLNTQQTTNCRRSKNFMLLALNQIQSNRLLLEIWYEYKTMKQVTVGHYTVIKSRKHGLQVRIPEKTGYVDYDEEVHQTLTKNALTIRVISGEWHREYIYDKELTILQRILAYESDTAAITNPEMRLTNMDLVSGFQNRNKLRLAKVNNLTKQQLKEVIQHDSYDGLQRGETTNLPSEVNSRAHQFQTYSKQESESEQMKVQFQVKNYKFTRDFLKENDKHHARFVADALMRALEKAKDQATELGQLIHEMATSEQVDMRQLQVLEELIRETKPDSKDTRHLITGESRDTDSIVEQTEESAGHQNLNC